MKTNRPKILGIVNITTDSFSDGGLYLNTEKAIEHALELANDGAEVIDLGAASSNPQTSPVSVEEEIKRLRPVIKTLKEKGIAVSVDTFKPEVQRFCMEQGVEYLNDIQGFPYPDVYAELAASDCKLIIMHSMQRIGPATVIDTQPEDVLTSVIDFFSKRIMDLENAGVQRERMILDPGMGFFLGSNPESSVIVLKNIQRLKQLFGLPVLIALSRKSFLGKITESEVKTRGAATLAAEIYAYQAGADFIRTHDAKALDDALKIFSRLA
jgi:dihydropteroate synthase